MTPRNKDKWQARPQEGQYFERRGERITERIARTVARKSWKWTLLNLAWTAGPVTYIAIQGGHYIGFGDTASVRTFFYFAGYTIIAGILAIIASLIHDSFYKPKVEEEQERLLHVIDMLFSIIIAARDRILRGLEENDRRILSAHYILQGAGISEAAISTAVMELTADSKLADMVSRVEVLRKQGMYARIEDEFLANRLAITAAVKEIESTAPETAFLLNNRLRGKSPDARTGIERSEGFIERIMSAAEENDLDSMTGQDALEMLMLTFELLNDRKIAVLELRFSGQETYEEHLRALAKARRAYRLAVRKRNSRMRALANLLYYHSEQKLVYPAVSQIPVLIAFIEDSIAELLKKGKDPFAQPGLLIGDIRAAYETIYSLNEEVKLKQKALERAEKRYNKTWEKHGKKVLLHLQDTKKSKPGFRIAEREIFLFNEQKIELCRRVEVLLNKISLHQKTGQSPHSVEEHDWPTQEFKECAAELSYILDELLEIGKVEEQLAIESSNAPNLGSLDVGLTAKTIAGWASLLIESVQQNRKKAAHRVASSLVNYYNFKLNDIIIDHFVNCFGADKEYLSSLQAQQSKKSNMESIYLPPPPALLSWNELIRRAKKPT
jgi:hypothetical protein